MSEQNPPSEYLVISRGQWDKDASPEEIQTAIDNFYVWLARMVDAGKMKRGQRLATGGATVSKKSVVTDGPYGEAKEVIGGYWLILAHSLGEAAQIAAQNPCLQRGLFYEIRPIDTEQASAYTVTNETPRER
ncbi:MAG TPA: YciI family protein [Pseudoxanthomonas sp.]